MENTIKIIPLTDFQKYIYANFVEIQANLISNIKGWSAITLHQKHNKNHTDNFPRVTLLQLNSIPDYINGVFLDYSDKQNILLGEIENVKSYSRTLETFKIDENNNLQYINLNSNPIIIRNLTTLDTLTFESHTTPKFTKDGEEVLKAKIIPATSEQKMQFLEHIQSLMYNLIPGVPYPVLTTEQLDSIPDYIDGKELNTINKTQLLFEHFVPFSENSEGSISDLKTYTVSNKGELIKTFEYKDKKNRFGNTYKKEISFVKKEDCIYVNRNLSQNNSTSDLVSEPTAIYKQTKKNDMKLKDRYTMTTKGYKNFISEMKNTESSEEWFQDGERVFSKKEEEYSRIYDESQPKTKQIYDDNGNNITYAAQHLEDEQKAQERYEIVKGILEQKESDKVKVIPATQEQKEQYSKYQDSKMFSDLEEVDFPELSKEQLDSVPDKINGIDLRNIDKMWLLLDCCPINDYDYYKIDKDNNIINIYMTQQDEDDPYEKTVIINKNQVSFNENLTFNTINNMSTNADFEKEQLDSKKIIIVPATNEQKEQCTKLLKDLGIGEYARLQKTNNIYFDYNTYKNYDSDIFKDKLGVIFSQEQLNSVPDTILHQKINDDDKALLLLEKLIINNGVELLIHESSVFIRYEDGENPDDMGSKTYEPLLKSEVSFNEKITLKTINIMSTNVDFDKAKDLDVVGFERPLKVYDPVSIIHEGKNLQGKVIELPSNGEIMLSISNSKDIKELTVSAKDQAKLLPMFILNKDEKMVYLKFTYDETIAALNKKEDIVLNHNQNEKSPVFNLMLGNKTDVIPFEKNIDNKMAPVEGRLELRRKAGSGEAYVHGEVKHKELNLSLPIYGLHLNDQQKEDLTNKKDIGLIQGFKSNDGKEFALWVSLDDKLNKVVTAPERSININMIFGVKTTEEQRNQIKSGEGAVVEIKGKEYLFQASAATTKADGLKSNAIDKPKDLKQDKSPEVAKEEKKSKSKALKI